MILGKKSRSSNQTSADNDSLVAVVKMRPEILQQMLQTVGFITGIFSGTLLKLLLSRF